MLYIIRFPCELIKLVLISKTHLRHIASSSASILAGGPGGTMFLQPTLTFVDVNIAYKSSEQHRKAVIPKKKKKDKPLLRESVAVWGCRI